MLSKSDDLEEILARIENIFVRESMRAHTGRERPQQGIVGLIENLPLPDITQILSMGMKTARVTLTSPQATGQIWFQTGSPVHAVAGDLAGRNAFYDMLRWKQAEFAIEHGVKTDEASIESDAMLLVMEGLSKIDEENAPADSRAS